MSVLLPAHGTAPFFVDAATSILNQANGVDLELVVILDRPDHSLELSSHEVASDPRVRVLNSPSKGLPAALNYGIQSSDSRYVARMDSDDLSLPNRLSVQIETLASNPGIVALGSQATFIDDLGRRVGVSRLPVDDASLRMISCAMNPFIHPSMVYARKAVERVGGYDESFFVAQDHVFHATLAREGLVANVNRRLLQYRVWNGQHTTTGNRREKLEKSLFACYRASQITFGEAWAEKHKGSNSAMFRLASGLDGFNPLDLAADPVHSMRVFSLIAASKLSSIFHAVA